MVNNEGKTFKQLAKEAKKRLKSGFWQAYGEKVAKQTNYAKETGVNVSKVVEYYESINLQTKTEENIFYQKVKCLIESEGEVSDAIGRLIDYEVYNELSYEAKQKYLLELSEKYREALKRYKREKAFENNI